VIFCKTECRTRLANQVEALHVLHIGLCASAEVEIVGKESRGKLGTNEHPGCAMRSGYIIQRQCNWSIYHSADNSCEKRGAKNTIAKIAVVADFRDYFLNFFANNTAIAADTKRAIVDGSGRLVLELSANTGNADDNATKDRITFSFITTVLFNKALPQSRKLRA
jgi:hypothetical protein